MHRFRRRSECMREIPGNPCKAPHNALYAVRGNPHDDRRYAVVINGTGTPKVRRNMGPDVLEAGKVVAGSTPADKEIGLLRVPQQRAARYGIADPVELMEKRHRGQYDQKGAKYFRCFLHCPHFLNCMRPNPATRSEYYAEWNSYRNYLCPNP